MDWSAATGWWVAVGLVVAAEMATGTFYLLMLALGMAAAALAAHAGAAFSAQLLAVSLVGGGATVAWHLWRGWRTPAPPTGNRDLNLDIGERVQVSAWLPDGSARVVYRGAEWTARYAGDGEPLPGEHVIRGVDGNRLLLGR